MCILFTILMGLARGAVQLAYRAHLNKKGWPDGFSWNTSWEHLDRRPLASGIHSAQVLSARKARGAPVRRPDAPSRIGRVDLGEAASFGLWLNVINLSPFEVELDRAEFEFSYAGAALKVTVLRKQKFAPGEIATFQISNPISDGLANQISRNRKVNVPDLDGALSGHIEFNCKLHPFPRQVQHLAGR